MKVLSQIKFGQLSWLYLSKEWDIVDENEIGKEGKELIRKWKKEKGILIYFDEWFVYINSIYNLFTIFNTFQTSFKTW